MKKPWRAGPLGKALNLHSPSAHTWGQCWCQGPSPLMLRSDFDVELVQHLGSDEMICKAARVSTLGAASIDSSESAGLINYLARNRHGVPFEHGLLTFRVFQPIAMWRETQTHRAGVSISNESARYRELQPVMYVPPFARKLVQVGKNSTYSFDHGTPELYDIMMDTMVGSYDLAWHNYQHMLKHGVAKEIARFCLPFGIYSSGYITYNPRSLMHFLSLRVKAEESTFPSNPQWEINQVADQMEAIFAQHFPLTHTAFVNNGRVSP